MIYGYCRKSRKEQSISRQVRNIKRDYPDAEIIKETFTGTKMNRPEWIKLYGMVQAGDTLVFDQVSRMSRDADEGYKVYEELFNRGVNLVFLKEHYIDSSVYSSKLKQSSDITTGKDYLDEGLKVILMGLAREQIKLAFAQAEKEVTDLHQRTKEGIETARLKGKQIGQVKGKKLFSKKAEKAKVYILEHCSLYEGEKTLYKIAQELNLTTAVIYKYNKELKDLHIKCKKDFLRYQALLFGEDRWLKVSENK